MIEIIPNWHPLLVHFTIALLSLSIVFFVLQKPFCDSEIGDNFGIFARYSLFLGVGISVLTLLAGWDAFNTVDHDTPSHVAMLDHRLWGLSTFGVFLIALIWFLLSSDMRYGASVVFLIFMMIGGGLLVTTGYKGSELVYKYGLGVQSLPKAENHDHASGHDHGSSADDHGDEDSHGHEAATNIDKDGISKQALMAEDMPHQSVEDDGHDHEH